MTVSFIMSRHETHGALDAFEVTIPPTAHSIVPHLHRNYDETIFGVDGIVTWTVDGVPTQIGPGEQLFIPRGVSHGFANQHEQSARMFCVLTPGLLGPEYFDELAFAMNEEGPTDYAALGTIMTRYGVIPATMERSFAPSPAPRLALSH
jgi:quercetin dioxygenase-like cupin family protein